MVTLPTQKPWLKQIDIWYGKSMNNEEYWKRIPIKQMYYNKTSLVSISVTATLHFCFWQAFNWHCVTFPISWNGIEFHIIMLSERPIVINGIRLFVKLYIRTMLRKHKCFFLSMAIYFFIKVLWNEDTNDCVIYSYSCCNAGVYIVWWDPQFDKNISIKQCND